MLQKIAEHPRHCFDDCREIEDIRNRYNNLDLLYEIVRKDHEFPEILGRHSRWSFRNKDGIISHIGPDGNLYFGGGCHRFAIAMLLKVSRIPARIGCIHLDALRLLESFRGNNDKKPG